jgi:hypothetical protein
MRPAGQPRELIDVIIALLQKAMLRPIIVGDGRAGLYLEKITVGLKKHHHEPNASSRTAG